WLNSEGMEHTGEDLSIRGQNRVGFWRSGPDVITCRCLEWTQGRLRIGIKPNVKYRITAENVHFAPKRAILANTPICINVDAAPLPVAMPIHTELQDHAESGAIVGTVAIIGPDESSLLVRANEDRKTAVAINIPVAIPYTAVAYVNPFVIVKLLPQHLLRLIRRQIWQNSAERVIRHRVIHINVTVELRHELAERIGS